MVQFLTCANRRAFFVSMLLARFHREIVTMKSLQKLCEESHEAEYFVKFESYTLDELRYKLGR